MPNILGWIEVGKVSAEKDDLLSKYYFDSGLLRKVINSPSCALVLGRKGAGKTAVFKYLKENAAKFLQTRDTLIPLSFEDYNWKTHALLRNDQVAESLAYKQSWRFIFLVEAIKGCQDTYRKLGIQVPASIEKASKLLEKLFSKPVPTIYEIVGNKLLGLSKFSLPKIGMSPEEGALEASGGEVEFEQIEKNDTLRSQLSGNIAGLINFLESALKSAMPLTGKIYLVFDRVDEAWDEVAYDVTKRIVAGLVSAAESFGLEFNSSVRVIVFLREDIFETLSINDKNKLREDSGALLKWDRDALHKLLLERINYFGSVAGQPAIADLAGFFDRKEMRQRTSPDSYILKRTMMRPRDMICFYSKLISTMKDRAADPFAEEKAAFEELNAELIYEAEPAYSEWLKQEIIDEWGVQRPEIRDLLSALQNHGSTNITETELHGELCKINESYRNKTIQPMVQFLFENSILGFKSGRATNWKFRCFQPSQGFVSSSEYRVHDGLVRVLNLKEPRGGETTSE